MAYDENGGGGCSRRPSLEQEEKRREKREERREKAKSQKSYFSRFQILHLFWLKTTKMTF